MREGAKGEAAEKAAVLFSLLALPLFEKEAKKRQGARTDLNIPALMPEGGKGEAREKAAVLFSLLALPLFEKEAKKRQATSGEGILGGKPLSALMREGAKGKAAEKAAVLFDVSPRYIQEAKSVLEPSGINAGRW